MSSPINLYSEAQKAAWQAEQDEAADLEFAQMLNNAHFGPLESISNEANDEARGGMVLVCYVLVSAAILALVGIAWGLIVVAPLLR